jgi:hypothetical protein
MLLWPIVTKEFVDGLECELKVEFDISIAR